MSDMGQMKKNLEENREHTGSRRKVYVEEPLSMESIFVAFVFFVVLSQFLLTGRSELLTQPLRPLIVIILTVQVVRRGRLKLPVCSVALVMSIYQFILWFFLYPDGGPLKGYLVLIFYFMMLFSVAGFPWNGRELRLILFASFLATFVCAAAFFLSNNMLDFSTHEYRFMGEVVNRNKHAYAFAFGIVLGRSYLSFGRGRNRLVILLMMLLEGYCLMYSECRGAFLGLFISLSIIAFNRAVKMWKNGNPYLVFFIFLYIGFLIAVYVMIKNSVVSRLVDGENLSGRDTGIEHAIMLFRQASIPGKIFGNGMLYEGLHTEGIGVHFVYLTYLLEAGIIGAVLIALIFVSAMRNIRGEIQWSIFMIALSRTFFEGMDYYIFIPLILSICISNYELLYRRSCRELFWRKRYLMSG